jgi:hypothetical protein
MSISPDPGAKKPLTHAEIVTLNKDAVKFRQLS